MIQTFYNCCLYTVAEMQYEKGWRKMRKRGICRIDGIKVIRIAIVRCRWSPSNHAGCFYDQRSPNTCLGANIDRKFG